MTNERFDMACPDLPMLSAYLDGKLDPADRSRIEDHISRCDDCYFVVRESAIVLAEAGTDGAGSPGTEGATSGVGQVIEASFGEGSAEPVAPSVVEPAAEPRRPKTSSLVRYLLPIAATIVVAAGALALWRQATRVHSYEDSVKPLVDAVGERRFFEPRLTGGFRYGPAVGVRRSAAAGQASEAWAVRAAAGELIERAAPSVEGRASRAAASLFTGDVDEAVSAYTLLVAEEPRSAEWASNLAAALIVRAASGSAPENSEAATAEARHEQDRQDALRFADQALRLDPSLSEARFNRGLALKLLGRTDEARSVFGEVEAQRDPWSEAAREQLRTLETPTGPP